MEEDREKVFDALRNCVTEPKFFPWEDQEKVRRQCVKVPIVLLLDTLNMLKEQPEQKHGYWKLSEKYYYDMVCSVCGETALTDVGNDPIKTYYCPWCGAKMDEQEGQK